ncbi:two-component sensor histidine kinase [Paenibacillus sp. CCS19]|uniref:sensor histidine kinase n=1 Tax=Paenibacillus sp. CCS19 TaxID=3158387 RepID=UPI00255EF4D5|nr:HAMP domain-containing sensor histidine kinase [Paenibacillus cellulosilyticus]GMK40306.1 two-component sensor histidine kinase [Paenibacillus cellulosilyticus]
MFHDTRRRLAVLNTVVLLFIVAVLGAVLYFHMQYRLYHDMDEILHLSENRIQSVHRLDELLRSDMRELQQDERTTYLFWNAKGELIGQLPEGAFSPPLIKQFQPGSEGKRTEKLYTIQTKAGHFRLLQLNCGIDSGSPPCMASDPIGMISIVRSLSDVEGMLHTQLLDIAAGTVIGAIVSIVAGYWLAGRALVPIRRSWDKQQRFVADASHELRSPTAVIHAQTELLLRHPNRSVEQESEHISVILRESRRMGKLIDDLLTLARTDSNQLQLQTAEFALDGLLREVVEHFRFFGETRGIDIGLDMQEPMSFMGAEGRIRQLLVIVLDNALKFTHDGGRIAVSCSGDPHMVVLRVEDNGCGISEEDLPHVFERFYRGDKSRSRTAAGTGLGLSIAEWIVQAHGGRIRIQSIAGEGTAVEIMLPRGR